jgi:hypothetical protein
MSTGPILARSSVDRAQDFYQIERLAVAIPQG